MSISETAGLVQVYTGNGKGKTSAAMGVALRALGHGKIVHIVYFLKGDKPYGEQVALTQLPNISFTRLGKPGFIDPENITASQREQVQKTFKTALDVVSSNKYDLVVLDEINIATAWKLINTEDVIDLIKNKPVKLNIILTGRYADPKLIEVADLVTEMLEIKHPYKQGIKAREGIDY